MIVIQGKVALEGYAENDLDGEVMAGGGDEPVANVAEVGREQHSTWNNDAHVARALPMRWVGRKCGRKIAARSMPG